MGNIIIVALIVAILAAAAIYVYNFKKSGKKCIGCSGSCECCKGKK